ncbi:MAG TPA: hypothetical protein VMW15_15295 [Terracidiphilus sp.]|jgi:hypothetical protein|nr:hypothetical protein [Terracidiphilus sp.]
MELFLNSGWALVAIASLCLWIPLGRRTAANGRLSFIALVVLIVTLFPVISVSDDLWCLHNPAETDTCQRRDYGVSCPHSIFPVATLPESAVAAPVFGFQRLALQPYAPPQLAANPALTPIHNRPPPSA